MGLRNSCSACQVRNISCLLQGFRECWPIRKIGAEPGAPYESAIPVSTLNHWQTGIKSR
jgi:hypothetical protein